MKIWLIRTNEYFVDSRLQHSVNALNKGDNDLTVVEWNRNQNYKAKRKILFLKNKKVILYSIGIKADFGAGLGSLKAMLKFWFRLFFCLIANQKSIDVIHSCDFDTSVCTFIYSKMFKKKFVYDIYDFYVDCHKLPNSMSKLVKKLDVFIINRSDATIICSENRKQQILPAKPKRIVVIHNSPKEVNYKKAKELNGQKTLIVYIGVLQNGRMIPELLEFVVKNKEFELIIGGYGQLESLVKMYSSMPKSGVQFIGKVEYKDVLKIEVNADIIPAIYDPKVKNHFYAAPNKFYEGLMLGKPLLMVKKTGMSNIVADNGIGEVMDYNEKSLSNSLIKLRKKIKNGEYDSGVMQSIYNKKFAIQIMDQRLNSLYESLGRLD